MPSLSKFDVTVPSGPFAAREALQQILPALAPLHLEVDELSTVELVLAEALNNIFEHAYEDGKRNGPINLSCQHLADGLHFTLLDEGLEIPNGTAPLGQPRDVTVELDDLPEGGFGWFLIKSLAKDVIYQRSGDRNQLELHIAVGCESQPI